MKKLFFIFSSCALAMSSAQASDLQGVWKYKNVGYATGYTADWIIEVNNNAISGLTYWYYNGATTGNPERVEGTINSNTVSITRYLSGVNDGKTQLFTGTVSGTEISGSWSGTGCTGSCYWSVTTIVPFPSSVSNSCSASSTASIAPNLNIHIPSANYQTLTETTNLWADLQFVPNTENKLLWELTNFGVNQ